MAATSANPELVGTLVAPKPRSGISVIGRARVALLRFVARYDEEPRVRLTFGILAIAAAIVLWSLSALLHELLVLLLAVVLPILTGFEPLQLLLAALPMNYVYAAAALRYAGQIEPAGLALSGEPGVIAAQLWPGVFFDPSYVSNDGLLSAVIQPGSSVMARVLASGIANAIVLAVGVSLAIRATRGTFATWLSALGLPRLMLAMVGVVLQLEVAARVLRAQGSVQELETLGVLPFLFHEILRLHREQYDRILFQLSRLVDPVFSEVVLLALYALVSAGWLLVLVAQAARKGHLRPALASWRGARFRLPAGRRSSGLAVELSLVAVLLAALPIGGALNLQSRYLEWDAGILPAELSLGPTEQPVFTPRPSEVPDSVEPPPVSSIPLPIIQPQLAPLPAPPPAIVPPPPIAVPQVANPPVVDVAPAAAAPAPIVLPPIVRPSVVGIGGRGFRFTYVVNGEIAEFKGMGYNVTYVGLPPAERAERLRRDFALMRETGVNTVVGWRTQDWDETVLDAAQAAGIGVVMPFDLDDKPDYSDRAVRSRLRSEILAWVARYRGHPAIRMWGIGNETLLHLKQAPRARAFAEFYTEVVDRVRQFDPDHPVLYREAEDLYIGSLKDAWATRGGPPHGFVVGMNFYTFRMRDAIETWPKKGMDVPLVVSEFAPAGIGRGERAAGYWRMWAMIRARPEFVLGAAPYVWNVEGPEPVDRLFGLVDGNAKPVDSALGTLRDMYGLPLPSESGPDVAAPALLGLRLADAQRVVEARGLKLAVVTYQNASQLKDLTAFRLYGIGNVMHQEPDPGARVARGGEVRIAIADEPPRPEYPIGRPRAD